MTTSNAKIVDRAIEHSLGLAERQIDDVLANSFPASDPPSWTLGRAGTDKTDHPVTDADQTAEAVTPRSFIRAMRSLLGALGLLLMVPLCVVLLPVAVAYRLMLQVTGWRLPHFKG